MSLQMLLYDSNTNLCVGEEATYNEGHDSYRVKVRGLWEERVGNSLGMSFDLELLGVDSLDRVVFEVGARREAWRANFSNGYGMFSLRKLK
ncbi:hypothetical protein J4467_03200 [Candidatus Woesearchaeota archaeon]|nr:hypothetical protein [Candidatus Woesearchaeota archaeon]